MAVSRRRKNAAYGVGQPLFDLGPLPIVTESKSPSTSDQAEIGTLWINKSTNGAWILASVVANSATWTPASVNAGATISTGDLAVSTGDVSVTVGDITAYAGNIYATNGAVVAGTTMKAVEYRVTGDNGTGYAGEVAFTDTVDTTLSTGAGVVLMKTVNAGDSSGWLKIYVGTNARYIPFWTTLSP